MLSDRFREIIEDLAGESPSYDQASVLQIWIRSVSVDKVAEIFAAYGSKDLRSLVRRLTPNPPSVVDLLDIYGYVLQVLYWYPIDDRSVYGTYDTEDIHSHFGFIVTRALVGNPYIETQFKIGKDHCVQKVGESLFREGSDKIIRPEDIHSVRNSSPRPAVSVRVVLPPSRAEMQVYDRNTLAVKEVITSSTERRTIELAGLLATLDRNRFRKNIADLKNDCLLPKSIVELNRLTEMGERSC